MNIYFSGIGGVGIGPLAEIALDAGYSVSGSDQATGLMTAQLKNRGVMLTLNQNGEFLRSQHAVQPLDWFVYSAAIAPDNPELVAAKQLGLRITKRDELLAYIIAKKQLKLIAVAGTHGKTTTTGMLVWLAKQFGVPMSYSVGTTLPFGPSGHYDPKSQYFIYECDEYDRNFLHFRSHYSLITSYDYDHPETYPTAEEYRQAFLQFLTQSERSVMFASSYSKLYGTAVSPRVGMTVLRPDDNMLTLIKLAGQHNRHNACLAGTAASDTFYPARYDDKAVLAALAAFPGTDRRFEKLADNLYTDYGHHPAEIAATLQMAREFSSRVVLVYQPHQNIRQHEIHDQYIDAVFENAEQVYWLPTYLTREDPGLPVLTPNDLTKNMYNKKIHTSELDDNLWQTIQTARRQDKLVLAMGAGTIDSWLRKKLNETN